jgi:hypothetical protein
MGLLYCRWLVEGQAGLKSWDTTRDRELRVIQKLVTFATR